MISKGIESVRAGGRQTVAWVGNNRGKVSSIVVLLLIGLAVMTCAQAGEINVYWTNPTTNTDGTAIPASGAGSLTGTRVQYGSCSGTAFGVMTAERVAAAPATTVSFTGVAPGTHCVRAFARNTYDSESVASNVASKIIPAPVPGAPVVSTVATTAYEIRVSKSGLRLLVAGSIALGEPCISQASDGLWFVGQAQVALKSSYRGGALVARCG